MTTTTNVNITDLVSNAASPEVTVNEAFELIDSLISGMVTINFASDADLTLATTGTAPQQWQYFCVNLTDTGVVLTTGRNVIVPTNKRPYLIVNNTAQTLTVKTSAGTGQAILTTAAQIVYCDGTNVIATA